MFFIRNLVGKLVLNVNLIQTRVMKMNKEQAKEMKLFYVKVISLFVIILTLFWSCGSDEEELTSSANEPEDTTEPEDTENELEDNELNAPIIQTPAPLIHLADNLDEQDQLGWCIDTRGNGFAEDLHAHSCKSNGGDVQFFYNEETYQICSVEYTGFCVEMSGGPVEGISLSLVESNADSPDQKFIYYEDSGEFRPEEDTNLCLAVGATSASAGIYMSRSLTLEPSSETEESLKKWIIVSN